MTLTTELLLVILAIVMAAALVGLAVAGALLVRLIQAHNDTLMDFKLTVEDMLGELDDTLVAFFSRCGVHVETDGDDCDTDDDELSLRN